MELTVTINAGESLIRVAEILAGGFSQRSITTPAIAAPVVPIETTAPAAPAAESATGSKKRRTAPVAEEKPAEVEETTEKEVSVEDLRAICKDKAQENKREEVKSLISSFGVDKITELNPAQYQKFYKEALAL